LGRTGNKTLTIAYQGERGAFSEEAAAKLAGAQVQTVPYPRFLDAFQAVIGRAVDAAVIPIENTLHGSVHENYDHLLAHDLRIVAETQVRIVHNLIAVPGVPFRQIRRVYSHPVALNQCLKFFEKHASIEKAPYYDTAGSVKMLMEQGVRDSAAIASSVAAEHYQAHILKRSIEDDRQNFTRFFLLMRPGEEFKGSESGAQKLEWKTSLVFTTKNRPGAIFRALGAFALRDLSLAKIESRPLRGKPWEYLFYLDFLGSMEDVAARNAVAHLGELADFHRVLGSYPRGA
jgi:prephenate dehydratase